MDSRAAILAMVCTMAAGFIWVAHKNVFGYYPIHPAFSETYIAVLVAFSVSVIGSLVKQREKQKRK